jgi:anti-sigma regulatory factor (Ser/Thr protein kinase)
VRDHLAAHHLQQLRDDAELLVTELVANVVLHVGGTVAVTVLVDSDAVALEVSDDSPVLPALRLFSRTSSTGRGMRLVHSLSAGHGVAARADGKTVWVRLTTATAERDEDELVASFADVDWLAELELGEVDGATASAPGTITAALPHVA